MEVLGPTNMYYNKKPLKKIKVRPSKSSRPNKVAGF